MTDKTKRQKKKRQKKKRHEDKKTDRYDGETMQNAHLTQPQVDKMTERIFFMLPTP